MGGREETKRRAETGDNELREWAKNVEDHSPDEEGEDEERGGHASGHPRRGGKGSSVGIIKYMLATWTRTAARGITTIHPSPRPSRSWHHHPVRVTALLNDRT